MIEDLIPFLRARYGEIEARALAADVKQGDPIWWVSPVLATAGQHFTVRSKRDNRPIARVERLEGYGEEPGSILDGGAVADHIAFHDPAYVLADVLAKRAIVGMYEREREDGHAVSYSTEQAARIYVLERAVELLAAAYADHPEYREEWRP